MLLQYINAVYEDMQGKVYLQIHCKVAIDLFARMDTPSFVQIYSGGKRLQAGKSSMTLVQEGWI